MKILNFALVSLFFALLPYAGKAQKIIASFEEEDDLNNMKVTNGVNISRSSDFAALRAYSCKISFPEKGGEADLVNLAVTNWNREEALLAFVWSDSPENVSLTISDSLNKSYTKQFSLKQGANHLQLLLSELTQIDKRKINLIGIKADKSAVLYLDYIALDQYQPVLDKLGRWDVEYSTKIKTPHYEWGSDFINGPIKSYSISPVFDGRGIIELAERLSLDFKVTTIGRSDGANRWGFGDFYSRRDPGGKGGNNPYSLAFNYIAEDLLFSKEFDVIIWPGMHKWESYPEQIRKEISERVKNGTGLVLLFPVSDYDESELWSFSPLKSINAGNAQSPVKDSETLTWPENLDKSEWRSTESHYITRGVAFEAFPWGEMGVYQYKKVNGKVLAESKNGNPVLATGTWGKGRVVAMAYPEAGLIPRVINPWIKEINYPYWEYMWSFMARSVIWASKKEPDISIENVSRTNNGVSVNLNNVSKKLLLDVQVIDDFGSIEDKLSVPVSPGQTKADIKFKNKLNGGKHIITVCLKEDKGTYDWYSLVIYTPKKVEIVKLENNDLEIPVGREVETMVSLKSDKSEKGTLIARLYDNYERLVEETRQEISFNGNTTVKTTLNSENILTHLGRSEFLFQINDVFTDHKAQEIFFLQPRVWDDYDVTMYHFGSNPVPGVWPAVDHQLQELNVTTLAAYTLANSKHANYKVQAQTRIQGVESPDKGPDLEYYEAMKKKYLETNDKNVLIRKYGLCDTSYLNSVKDDLTEKISEWKKFSPSAYYIYEEPSVTRYDDALDLDFSVSSLNAMREWLKEQYKTLEALNNQWGTDFKQWMDVVPDDSREARIRGNYSSWADHRTFMENCWADQFKYVQNIVNKIDPGGLVQLSGTQSASSHNGYDYSKLNQYVGQMNPYNIDNQLEYHHNFNPNLKVSGQAGYGALGKGVTYDFFNHIFLKETGGSYIFWQVSCLNPDLSICQSGLDMKAGFDEMLKRGIGRLVSIYEPENDLKVAIHFSYPSVHAAWIVDGKIVPETEDNVSETLKQYNRDRDGWVKILHDAGVGFDFISYGSIEQGDLALKGYKVLILPMSLALSNKEVDQIRDFVNNGGLLISDALAGVMDDHTNYRSKRALADVFGIKERPFTREELITPAGESKLEVNGASFMFKEAGKPEILFNKYGTGTSVLLNYFMDNYPEEKLSNNNISSILKIKKVFTALKLEPTIRLTENNGEPAYGVEKYSFSANNSSAQLLGLLPGKTGEEKDIHIQLNDNVYLYDIRNEKYLGYGNDFKIKAMPAESGFYGLLKGTIDEIEIKTPEEIRRGKKVSGNIKIAGKGLINLKSVVHVDVINPAGEIINYYSTNCEITNNSGSFSYNTAQNDTPGDWKIRFTEVISGKKKEITTKVY